MLLLPVPPASAPPDDPPVQSDEVVLLVLVLHHPAEPPSAARRGEGSRTRRPFEVELRSQVEVVSLPDDDGGTAESIPLSVPFPTPSESASSQPGRRSPRTRLRRGKTPDVVGHPPRATLPEVRGKQRRTLRLRERHRRRAPGGRSLGLERRRRQEGSRRRRQEGRRRRGRSRRAPSRPSASPPKGGTRRSRGRSRRPSRSRDSPAAHRRSRRQPRRRSGQRLERVGHRRGRLGGDNRSRHRAVPSRNRGRVVDPGKRVERNRALDVLVPWRRDPEPQTRARPPRRRAGDRTVVRVVVPVRTLVGVEQVSPDDRASPGPRPLLGKERRSARQRRTAIRRGALISATAPTQLRMFQVRSEGRNADRRRRAEQRALPFRTGRRSHSGRDREVLGG